MIACLYIPLHTCDDARTITMVKERWQLAHRLLGRRTSRHQQGPGHAGLTASSFLSSTLSCICLLLLHPATLHLPRRPALQYCCSAQCHHTQPTPAAAAGIRSPCCISGGRASAVHSGAQNLQQGWHGRRRVLEQAGTCVQLMWKESIFPSRASQPRFPTTLPHLPAVLSRPTHSCNASTHNGSAHLAASSEHFDRRAINEHPQPHPPLLIHRWRSQGPTQAACGGRCSCLCLCGRPAEGEVVTEG